MPRNAAPTPQMPDPSHKDLFVFFRLGLVTGLIDRQSVVAWADREILAGAVPDFEIAELSLAGGLSYSRMVGLLGGFVDAPVYGLPLKLLLALAGLKLREDPGGAERIILGLRLLNAEAHLPGEYRTRLGELEADLASYWKAGLSPEELSARLSRFLAPFADYADAIGRMGLQ
jgi:hypothetical protein